MLRSFSSIELLSRNIDEAKSSIRTAGLNGWQGIIFVQESLNQG